MPKAFTAALCLVAIASLFLGNLGKALAIPGEVTVESISITDMDGNIRKAVGAGSDFIANVQLANTGSELRHYVAVIEVRDAGGITASLNLSNGVLGPGQRTSVSLTMRLDEGSYSLRAFVIDDDLNPRSFSPIISSSVPVSKIHYPGIYVPLYKYPDLWKPDGIWNTLLQAKKDHGSVLFVVTINPASGPGSAQNAAYANAIAALKKGGVEYILGYVPTRYAVQDTGHSLADLKGMMDRYRAWYPEINGVSFDQVSASAANLSFYKELAAYARSHGMEFVRANPGTRADEAYSSGIFDNVAIYEGKVLPSASQLQENTYFPKYAPQSFSFISRDIASLDLAYISQIRNYVGLLYITDDVESDADANPYNKLPSYFAELVRLLDPDLNA